MLSATLPTICTDVQGLSSSLTLLQTATTWTWCEKWKTKIRKKSNKCVTFSSALLGEICCPGVDKWSYDDGHHHRHRLCRVSLESMHRKQVLCASRSHSALRVRLIRKEFARLVHASYRDCVTSVGFLLQSWSSLMNCERYQLIRCLCLMRARAKRIPSYTHTETHSQESRDQHAFVTSPTFKLS